MAKQVKTNAPGNAPDTASPGPTPAPAKRVVPQAPDEVTFIRHPSPAGYGQNGPQPSSVNPGQQMLSPLAANMKASVDDDGCLDRIIANGTARQDTSVTGQLRQIADNAQPTAYGMRSRNNENPLEKVPASTGATVAQPVRKPV